MSHVELILKYDGPAVEDGSMDVRDLAPALLAVGNLIDACNEVINGKSTLSRVQVRTVAPGSFSVGLDVAVDFIKTIKDIFSGPEATAAANIITILTGSGATYGVFRLVAWLRGKQPDKISKSKDGKVNVEIDGKKIEVDEIVARVSLDVNVRLAIERVVAEPLSKDGIDSVEFGNQKHVEKIEKKDGSFFLAPMGTLSGEYESRYRGPFSIVSLSFKQGNKWKLNDGKSQLSATVLDENYLRRVDNNEISFAKGDVLICDVRVMTRQDIKGLKAEYFIERVVEHRHPEQQKSFFESPEFQRSSQKKPDANK